MSKQTKSVIVLALSILLINFIVAVPTDLHLTVQTTDNSGTIQTGSFQFRFDISTNSNCAAPIYSYLNTTSTDNRGIVSFYLSNANTINYNQTLYLCYYRDNVLKSMQPISGVPYAYYAQNSSFASNSATLNGQSSSSFVPYTGADKDVNLGNNDINFNFVQSSGGTNLTSYISQPGQKYSNYGSPPMIINSPRSVFIPVGRTFNETSGAGAGTYINGKTGGNNIPGIEFGSDLIKGFYDGTSGDNRGYLRAYANEFDVGVDSAYAYTSYKTISYGDGQIINWVEKYPSYGTNDSFFVVASLDPTEDHRQDYISVNNNPSGRFGTSFTGNIYMLDGQIKFETQNATVNTTNGLTITESSGYHDDIVLGGAFADISFGGGTNSPEIDSATNQFEINGFGNNIFLSGDSTNSKIYFRGNAYDPSWGGTLTDTIFEYYVQDPSQPNEDGYTAFQYGNNPAGTNGFRVKNNIYLDGQIKSELANGTAPINVTSTTMNPNLNADLLDGKHGSEFVTPNVTSDITPNQTSTWSLGSSVLRWLKGWFVNLDVSGNASINTLNVTGNTVINGNVAINGNLSVKRPYGMFSSTEDQTLTLANTAYPVTFNYTEDAYEITREGDSNFTFAQSGDYLVEISLIAQTAVANKNVHVFPQIMNSTGSWNTVPRSNTQTVLRTTSSDYVISVPFILDIHAYEKFRLMWGADDNGIFLNYKTNTSWSPETPSIIMTISKIGGSPDIAG